MKRSGSVIAFLISPRLEVSGGLMETFSLCRETRRLEHVHGAEVMLCTVPGPRTYERNDLFENDEVVQPFQALAERMSTLESLVLHTHTWPWDRIYAGLAVYAPLLRAIPHLQINVLNMHLGAMPSPGSLASLFTLTPNVTQTTAHDRYATQAVCDGYGVPVHHLSAWVDPGHYRRATFAEKERVIAYSHDDHEPMRPAVLDALRKGLPGYELVEVLDMHYSDYKDLIARARHVISFGEGFDGYFIETVFAGGIPFAVYNDFFFPSRDYGDYINVYADYDTMARSIVDDVAAFDDEARYMALNAELYGRLAELYDVGKYRSNIERFYRCDYDFTPSPATRSAWLSGVISEKDERIDSLERTVRALTEDGTDQAETDAG